MREEERCSKRGNAATDEGRMQRRRWSETGNEGKNAGREGREAGKGGGRRQRKRCVSLCEKVIKGGVGREGRSKGMDKNMKGGNKEKRM